MALAKLEIHKLRQSLRKYCRQFSKLNKIGVSLEYFTANFSKFFGTTVKICVLVARWRLAIKSKLARDY